MPHHHPGQLALAGHGHGHGIDHAALAHHRDTVRHRHHFIELVRDKDDGLALFFHPPQDCEQLRGLLWRQDAGRFVENQDAGASQQCLQDLHALLLTDGQLPDRGAWVHAQTVAFRKGVDLPLHVARWKEEPRARQSQCDVLRYRVPADEEEVLRHHADAVSDGVARRADAERAAVDDDLDSMRIIYDVVDVHECRLDEADVAKEGVY